jgi:hypothetical protein
MIALLALPVVTGVVLVAARALSRWSFPGIF